MWGFQGKAMLSPMQVAVQEFLAADSGVKIYQLSNLSLHLKIASTPYSLIS